MKKGFQFIVLTIVGVIVAWYAGAMFNFFPFMGDDLIMREIGFCTLIISAVVAACTVSIKNTLNEKQKKD